MSSRTSPLIPPHPYSSTPSSSSSPTVTPTPSTLPTPRQPLPPPRSALRVNTDFGRYRSNSSAPPPPLPLEIPHHQFSRSMSHASPLPYSPTTTTRDRHGRGTQGTPVLGVPVLGAPVLGVQTQAPAPARDGGDLEKGGDVMLAVNGLRARMDGSSPSSPIRSSSPLRSSTSRNLGEDTERPGSQDEDQTMKRIREALDRSGDEGDTLDLSRRGIEGIGAEAVEMLRKGVGKESKGVWRLALSYNSLRDGCIDDSFSKLSRLRYLNLKGNNLSAFPHALTEMPALEILDLSKNRLTKFPDVPGKLSQLKVLSLTNNKIYTLPAYLVSFNSLKVFKVDSNPIEWPPREVLGALVDNEPSRHAGESGNKPKKDEDLRPWIENMKSWMRQRSAETDRLLERTNANVEQDGYLASEEEPSSAMSFDEPPSAGPWANHSSSSLVAMASLQTIRPLREETQPSSPSMRLPLGQRNRSATMSNDSLVRSSSPGLFPPSALGSRHDRSTSASSYTPPVSASTASSSTPSEHSRKSSRSGSGLALAALANLPLPPPIPASTGHNRGASYTATQRLSANLTAKKSLPDLRQSHAKIIAERRDSGGPVEETRHLGMGISSPISKRVPLSPGWGDNVIARSPLSAGASMGAELDAARTIRRTKLAMAEELGERRDTHTQEGPPVDESRNSYFRRLSTLPVSTISKAIPPALLKFIDAIRGILFALSQLHSALRQYLVFAVDDRIAGIFSRVMEPAANYMNTLINALDRFDSMSRRNTPPVQAVRGVIQATRESVGVFAKVVAILRMQVPALRGCDERYTRTLQLMIYGSMAEVACSWTAMAPLLEEIKTLLSSEAALPARAFMMGGTKMVQSNSFSGRTPISPIPERGESHSPPSVTRTNTSVGNSPLHQMLDASPAPTPSLTRGGGRISRRQAGSFSTEDVERGMLMGSPKERERERDQEATGNSVNFNSVTMMGTGTVRHRPSNSAHSLLERTVELAGEEEQLVPTSRSHVELHSMASTSATSIPITPPEEHHPAQPTAMAPTTSQMSTMGHKPSSSSGSSHALSLSTGLPPPLPLSMRKLSVDVRPPTPASVTLFDEDLLDVIEKATDIAFTVWLKLAEDIGASDPFGVPPGHIKTASQSSLSSQLESAHSISSFSSMNLRPQDMDIPPKILAELVHLLGASEQITATLRESLMGLRANPLSYASTTLPDDAQAFIKTVVKVSEMVKIVSAHHTFPASVRQSCSRLTQATRECAILMQVSSLRPGSSTSGAFPAFSGFPNPNSARPYSPMHYSRSSQGGAGSSSEDLQVPSSGGWDMTTTTMASGAGAGVGAGAGSGLGSTPRAGLRGLQLPTRQAALGMGRSKTSGDAGYYGSQRGQLRSAQPDQVAF